jgi:hypothetical protein
MFCVNCGVEAPTRYVAFYKEIGALVVRFFRSAKGEMCKSCIHQLFWKMTLINLFLGWWGIISFLFNPFLILNNIYRYLTCISLAPVPLHAIRPVLTEDVVAKLNPYLDSMVQRLNNGEKAEVISAEIARKSNLSAGHVWLYLKAVSEMRGD